MSVAACTFPSFGTQGSLTLIQGFLPQLCEVQADQKHGAQGSPLTLSSAHRQHQALRNMENIRFYVGDQDELGSGLSGVLSRKDLPRADAPSWSGHREYLRGIKESLKAPGLPGLPPFFTLEVAST